MIQHIAFLTDFGLDDAYVGIVKGVIKSINPNSSIIDLTHNVPFGNIHRAAFILWQSMTYFPSQTVFLCVVDPGVGSVRSPIIIDCDNKIFVGPDNGLFTYVTYRKHYKAWKITNSQYFLKQISNTFHGRDIFAPVAAFITQGVPLSEFGELIDKIVMLPFPKLEQRNNAIMGEIMFFDRFGNGITSIGKIIVNPDTSCHYNPWVGKDNADIFFPCNQSKVFLPNKNNLELKLKRTFSDIPIGEAAAVIGSSGMIEIVANFSSAEKRLSLEIGEPVYLSF